MSIEDLNEYYEVHSRVSQQCSRLMDVLKSGLAMSACEQCDMDGPLFGANADIEVYANHRQFAESQLASSRCGYIKRLLSGDQPSLLVYLKAKDETSLGFDQIMSLRDQCLHRLMLSDDSVDLKQSFKDALRAFRTVIVPLINHYEILFLSSNNQTDALMALHKFLIKWSLIFADKCSQSIGQVRDILELSALWTQCLLLDKMLSLQGASILLFIQSSFVHKAIELICEPLHDITDCASCKVVYQEGPLKEICGNPKLVILANAIIDVLNLLRHFAHELVRLQVHKQVHAFIGTVELDSDEMSIVKRSLEPFLEASFSLFQNAP